ncbi:MAG: protein translocase subunit SecD, partial [Oscillospiraceae bacterium]
PEEAIKEISATALLTFRPGKEYEKTTTDEDGNQIFSVPKGKTAETILIEGADVVSAKPSVQPDQQTGKSNYVVSLEFSDTGAKKFAEATKTYKGQTISIWMDDVMISYPNVETEITDGKAVITGAFTSEEVTALAAKIQGGALPFALKTTNYSTINPSLGLKALDAMSLAGILAFALVSVFMILLFRLPGFVAVISLAGQMALSFAAISGYFPVFNSFTMTLPGIAGIILSIGMGVDANIITATRIKEELATGKTLDGAIQKGSSESFSAIFDGNITIIIVAVMLIGVFGPANILSKIFGESTTGAIYSFGFTLLVGVIGNFIMGVTATRLMVKSLSGFKALRNKWLYGGTGK